MLDINGIGVLLGEYEDIGGLGEAGPNKEEVKRRENELLKLRDTISQAQRLVKEWAARTEELLVVHIDEYGDIEIGEGKRLYVGVTKTNKAIDDSTVFDMVMEVAHGDLSIFKSGENGVLVSNPWKSGAVRQLVGEELYAQAFRTEIAKDLKTGAAKRSVKETRFD